MTLARNKKKPTKKQIIRKKKLESDKRFRKFLINGVVISAICMFLFYAFVVKRCDTLLLISSYMLYGKQIDPECICHAENRLKEHKTSVLKYSKNTFYVCGSGCCHRIEKHYQKYAFTIDAVSGDSILKSNAIIGLKERGKPEIVYFDSKTTFNEYYAKE